MAYKMLIKWQDRSIDTVGEIVAAIGAIIDAGDKEQAVGFRRAYILAGVDEETVDANIGWLMGEFDREKMQRGLDLFEAVHPIAGRKAAGTDREAMALGALWGLGHKLPVE